MCQSLSKRLNGQTFDLQMVILEATGRTFQSPGHSAFDLKLTTFQQKTSKGLPGEVVDLEFIRFSLGSIRLLVFFLITGAKLA